MAVHAKPNHARGPDGVTQADLLALPSNLVARLLDLYRLAEQTGRWPQQLLVGIVTSLAKTESATEVKHFRPITVVALAYRVWSSIRTKKVLKHLAAVAPAALSGALPGKSASKHLGGSLSSKLNTHWSLMSPFPGFLWIWLKPLMLCLGIVFAFGLRAGIPLAVVRGWAGAVVACTRRFKVRHSVGPALIAVTGFPEGDPLSVVAMCLVDLALHWSVTSKVPGSCVSTYMDHWKATSSSSETTLAALDATVQFTAAWDIAIDPSKTTASKIFAHGSCWLCWRQGI